MNNIFHPDRGIFQNLGIFCDQFTTHDSDISGCCVMICRFCQPTAIFKMGVFHSEFCRSFVHVTDKFLFAAADMLSHCYTGIISRCNYNTFDHSFYCLSFTFFQKYLGTTHGFGVGAGCDGVVHFQAAFFQCIKN